MERWIVAACGLAAWALLCSCSGAQDEYRKGEELLEGVREGHSLPPRIVEATPERIAQLRVPEGFRVNVFATGLGKPRILTVGPNGSVYVTRRESGSVLALRDTDGDGRADERTEVVPDLPRVHGIAIHDGNVYLATVREVYVAPWNDGKVGKPKAILKDLPPGGNHPNRTLAIGPDGMLYVTVGSTCNCCVEEHAWSATILRAKPDGSDVRVFAKGLRNTIGFGWEPRTGELYGMDHGTDWLGDDEPPEELNLLREGRDYGWPFVHGYRKTIPLKTHPAVGDLSEYAKTTTPPVGTYTAHAAPIQMAFYTGESFPEEYRGDAFVAMHGSWNRKPPSGYEVVRIDFRDGKPAEFLPFLTGFRVGEDDPDARPTAFARPAGIAIAPDGALLVSDDANGAIYRVAYVGAEGTRE